MKNYGFTMIELLIVITLSVLLTAIVAPNLWGQLISYREKTNIESFLSDVKNSMLENRKHGGGFVLSRHSDTATALAKKHNIEIVNDQSVTFRADKVCSGGVILIKTPNERYWRLSFSPLDCKLDLIYVPKK